MPKGGKKKKGKNVDIAQVDVTVNDFADSSQSKGRVKKPVLNYLSREVQQVWNKPEGTWDGGDIPDSWDETEEFHGTVCQRRSGKSRRRRDSTRDNPEIHYPVEIWFLLAKYIRPEDVKTFAAICRSTYYVVHSRCFWIRMYKRYHKPTTKLPFCLQPQSIIASEFLRLAVVRALYQMYPPFLKRKLKSTTILPKETCRLKRSRCISVWYLQEHGKWQFYFKFAMPPNNSNSEFHSSEGSIPVDRKRTVAKSPEEDCCIVCVTVPYFRYFPPTVMGSHLVDIWTTISRDLLHHKIQMVFDSACSKKVSSKNYSNLGNSDYGGILDFDPVESVTILHWWHPEYPVDM